MPHSRIANRSVGMRVHIRQGGLPLFERTPPFALSQVHTTVAATASPRSLTSRQTTRTVISSSSCSVPSGSRSCIAGHSPRTSPRRNNSKSVYATSTSVLRPRRTPPMKTCTSSTAFSAPLWTTFSSRSRSSSKDIGKKSSYFTSSTSIIWRTLTTTGSWTNWPATLGPSCASSPRTWATWPWNRSGGEATRLFPSTGTTSWRSTTRTFGLRISSPIPGQTRTKSSSWWHFGTRRTSTREIPTSFLSFKA